MKQVFKRYLAGTLSGILLMVALLTGLPAAFAAEEGSQEPQEEVAAVVEEPIAEEPPAPEPIVVELAEEPSAPEPAPEAPAAEEPAAEAPAVEEPAASAEATSAEATSAEVSDGKPAGETPLEEIPDEEIPRKGALDEEKLDEEKLDEEKLDEEELDEKELAEIPAEEAFTPVTATVTVKYLLADTREVLADASFTTFTLDSAEATANYDVTDQTRKQIDGYTLREKLSGSATGTLAVAEPEAEVICWYDAEPEIMLMSEGEEPTVVYTVTLNPNGGTVDPTSKAAIFDAAIGALPTPTWTGYIFDGWFTAAEGGTEVDEDTVYTTVGDSTVYAHWRPNTYTITLNPNGTAAAPATVDPTSKAATLNAAIGELPTPTRAGYTFDGWFTAAAGGTEVTAATVYTTAGDSTVYAHWTNSTTYTVKVQKRWRYQDPEGKYDDWRAYEDVASVTLHDGDAYDMTSRLYTVAGAWEAIEMAGDPVTGAVTKDIVIQQDVTVQMYRFRHSISFYEKGTNKELTNDLHQTSTGYGTSGPAAGKKETYPGFSDVITGYTLAEMSGYMPYAGTLSFTMSLTNRSETRITKLYYTANKYTLTFDPNGGTIIPASKEVTFNAAIGMLAVPTRTGYTFDGWFTAKEGGTPVTTTTVYKTADDSTVYAHWTKSASATYTLTFDPNGTTEAQATVNPTSKTVTNGEAIGAMPTPIRAGYKFKNWYTAAEGGTVVTSGIIYETAGDSTVYAHWAKIHTVTYDGNGGSAAVPGAQVEDGYEIGPLPTAERSGYSCDGWYTAREGGEKIEMSHIVTGDETLYAHWTKNPTTMLTVTFDPNGGVTIEPTRQVEKMAAIGALPNAVRADYTLAGWFTAAEGGTQIGSTLPIVSDVTYYAHWIKNYKVRVTGCWRGKRRTGW